MTKQELIKILDEKIENALHNLRHKMAQVSKLCAELTYDELEQSVEYDNLKDEENKLIGEIDAYTDIKNLLENEVLEDDNI